MDAGRFIARRIRFKGKISMVSIAISFFIIIIAQSISAGFRKEIRRGVSSISGDVQITSPSMNFISEEDPISLDSTILEQIMSVPGVKDVTPAVYRVGIVKQGEDIHGIMLKGVPSSSDSLGALNVSIPARLSQMLGIAQGDEMLTYFIGDRIRVRKFIVGEVYRSALDSDDNLIAYVDIKDLQRLNGWDEDEISALEVSFADKYKSPLLINEKNTEIGVRLLEDAANRSDNMLVSTSVVQNYPQLFDWLNLIDFNVVFILILMTIVAGFNMISGLLILLFQHISTIGTLKALGMTDRAISRVFTRVSSSLVLKGMAIGNALALLFCLVQHLTHFLKLNPENYFISFVPVSVNVPLLILADLITYTAIMLLVQLPSRFISKVDPAQSVRAQ